MQMIYADAITEDYICTRCGSLLECKDNVTCDPDELVKGFFTLYKCPGCGMIYVQ